MKQSIKAENTKQLIVTTAYELFAEKGFEKTSMQDIIDKAGFSKGAIYYHFNSKLEILEYMTITAQAENGQFLKNLAEDEALNSKQKTSKWLEYLVNSENQKKLIDSLWLEKIPFSLINEIRHLIHDIAPFLNKIIEQGVAEGVYQKEYSLEAAELLLVCIDVWLDPVLLKRTYAETAKRIDFVVTMLQKINVPVIDSKDAELLKNFYKQICKGDDAL